MRSVTFDYGTVVVASALAAASFVCAALVGCASTQFPKESPGQPETHTYATVPAGMVGVCKRVGSKKPPIVNRGVWDHAVPCRADTPKEYLRIGTEDSVQADRRVEKLVEALREGPKADGGNTTVLGMLRVIRQEGLQDRYLKNRVMRDSTRTAACDVSYLLNTMEGESARLQQGDRCAVYVYDQTEKREACLFDTQVPEAVWLTGAWACLSENGTYGKGLSCHKLCAYDDYCAKQVSCAQPDVDLALCSLGVCAPEPDSL